MYSLIQTNSSIIQKRGRERKYENENDEWLPLDQSERTAPERLLHRSGHAELGGGDAAL